MAGCTISSLAFTMAMELIIQASKWVVGGERLQSGQRLPPIRAYMDDRTIDLNHCMYQTWAWMKLKPSKSRNLSIVRGKLVDQIFHIDETPIPTVLEMPVKSLGRWYYATINNTLLPGKLKLWCLQFGLLPRLIWPLTVYKVPITKIEILERTVSYIKKLLGTLALPQ